MEGIRFKESRIATLCTEEYRAKIHAAYCRESRWKLKCFHSNNRLDYRDDADWPISRAPFERHRVFTGYFGQGTYNHHTALTRWRGKYVLAFSNCERDEQRPGQRVMISFSDDLRTWDEAVEIIPGDKANGVARNTTGIYADDERIVVYVMTNSNLPPANQWGSWGFKGSNLRQDAFVSTDGVNWEERRQIVHNGWLFEGPRATREGKLLVSGARDGQPLAYMWDASDPASAPEIFEMPHTDPSMNLFHAEASWYQLDSGRIMMFWRDEGATGYLAFTCSDDGGRTWMKPTVTDIPDSMSRVYAGRLSDGRYYLVGNTWPQHIDRMHLMLSISDDGETFSEIYTLVDDPTSQRAVGILKVDGYQYPCCIAEQDRLIVGYSINKEDIEVGIVDTTKI